MCSRSISGSDSVTLAGQRELEAVRLIVDPDERSTRRRFAGSCAIDDEQPAVGPVAREADSGPCAS